MQMGCTQRETDVGIQAIVGLPDDRFAMVMGEATHSAHWNPQFSNGLSSTSLFVGNAKGLYSFTVIRFNVSAALPDSFRVDTLPPKIQFHRNRVWPDQPLGELRFVMRECTTFWEEANLLPNSLPDYESFPVLDSALIFNATDSLYFFEVPFDLWTRWAEGDTTTFGVLLEPRFEDYMVEWYSSEYVNVAYPEYPPALLVSGQIWRSADSLWVDSTLSIPARHDAYLTKDRAERQPERMFVTQGYAERTALFFPVDSLSRGFRKQIARAELHLFADRGHSADFTFIAGQNIVFKDGFLNDSSWTSAAQDSAGFWNPEDFDAGYVSETAGAWDSTNTRFTLNVTGPISNWVGNPVTNGGLQVLSTSENSFLSRVVFHSHLTEDTLNPDLRPRLYIWYTESEY